MGIAEQPWPLARGNHEDISRQLPRGAQPIELALKALWVEANLAVSEQRRQNLFQRIGVGQGLQLCQPGRTAPLARRCKRVEHPPPAKGALGALVTQDQVITLHRLQWRIHQQLREHSVPRRQAFTLQ